MADPCGSVSTVLPCCTSAIPQLERAPVQSVSADEAVMVDCAGVGMLCGEAPSSSITQSALPAVSPWVASKRNLLLGVAVLMVKLSEALVPPPGPGEKTVTDAAPVVAIFAAGTTAANCEELVYVVVSGAPFQIMTELLTKPDPVTVNVNAELPAPTAVGLSVFDTGKGLLTLIVKERKLLEPPPGGEVNTEIVAVPAVLIFPAGIRADNFVALTKVVVSALLFHFITDPFIKLLPLTMRGNAGPPVIAVAGDNEAIVGRGLLFPLPSEPVLLQPANVNKTIKVVGNLNNFIGVIFKTRM